MRRQNNNNNIQTQKISSKKNQKKIKLEKQIKVLKSNVLTTLVCNKI